MDMNVPALEPAAAALAPRRRIVIVGGGFSGAACALNLLRDLPRSTASITIIEPRGTLGAGLAYSTADGDHRINVAACRLLVLAEAPGAFNDWLITSGVLHDDPAAVLDDGRIYPRRGLFGLYVDRLLREAAAVPNAAVFTHVQARAEAIEATGSGYSIAIDDGSRVMADVIILAVSHPPPAVPRPLRPVASYPKFFADPWVRDIRSQIARQDRVLIIGTALTTADVISSLHVGGHKGEIVAISRRGLVSRQREVVPTQPFGDFKTNPSRTARALLQEVRRTIREAAASFSCWEAVMERIRAHGGEIWAALPDAERARFLRHVRPFWDAHRYQLAPQPAAIMKARCRMGLLRFLRGRVEAAAVEDGRFRVTLHRRQARDGETLVEMFDVIVNCTGPDHASVTRTNPALASLARAGLIVADKFGLGVETDANARALGAGGQPSDSIFVAGPLARAAFGELMGLPQVSLHAAYVANQISSAILGLQPAGPAVLQV